MRLAARIQKIWADGGRRSKLKGIFDRVLAMKPLLPPDSHFVSAAEGWFGLEAYHTAYLELENVSPENKLNSAVLEIRWQICSQLKKWDECLAIAEALIKSAPKSSSGWIHKSYTLHELKRTQEAWANLMTVADRFPKEATIRYNLACYACQLGRKRDAWILLEKAMEVGDEKEIKLMALDDPDLESLWVDIAEI